jgi:hypothetical protein
MPSYSIIQMLQFSSVHLLVTPDVVPISPILVTVMMETIRSSETSIITEPKAVTIQETAFFELHEIYFLLGCHVHVLYSKLPHKFRLFL